MKKSLLLVAMLLMLGTSAFAIGGVEISLGPKVGYQTARLSYQKADIKSDFKNHMTFGLFGRVGFGSLYVQPEVLYFKTENVFDMTMESTGTWLSPEGNVQFTLNSANIQVPVLVGIKLIDLDIVTLRAQAGPTANFTIASTTLFNKTYTLTNSESGETQTIEETLEAMDTKAIAWGMQAGVGADVLGKFTIDINYNFGLSKVFSTLNNTSLNNYFDFSNIDDTKQSLFMVTLGFKFL